MVARAKLARRIHVGIAKRDVPRAQRMFETSRANVAANAKKVALDVQREVRRDAARRAQRVARDTPRRCRKMMSEMANFWRRNERLEKDRQRAAEKEKLRERRAAEELREAKRQQRKFNFLVTQTELYAHFMSKKGGGGDGYGGEAGTILDQLDSDEVGRVAVPGEGEDEGLGVEGLEDAAAMKARALANANAAVEANRLKTAEYDQRRFVAQQTTLAASVAASADGASTAPVRDGQAAFDSTFSLANPNMADTQEVLQPSMLRCKLKPYQIVGLRWLANLYQQGINGILADEMGLGKTVQSIATLAHLAETENIWGPFLVVAPVSTLHNWAQELLKFTPEFKVLPYWGDKKDRNIVRKHWNPKNLYTKDAEFHVLLTSYEMVRQLAVTRRGTRCHWRQNWHHPECS